MVTVTVRAMETTVMDTDMVAGDTWATATMAMDTVDLTPGTDMVAAAVTVTVTVQTTVTWAMEVATGTDTKMATTMA